MWPFSRKLSREELMGHKRVHVNGMAFTIRRLNPLLDFPEDKMPQIFTSFVSRRPPKPETNQPTPEDLKKHREDMYAVLEAGIVEPKIVKDGQDGIRAADLFRDPTMGPKIYIEVLAHSLHNFRGLKGLFFFHKIRLSLWTQWLKGMGELRRKSSSRMAVSL